MTNATPPQDEDFALIICEHGKAQQVLLKYTVMILNFRYGMQMARCENLKEGVALLRRRASAVRAVFIIQNDYIQSKMFLQGFTLQGRVPTFILCPTSVLGQQFRSARGVPRVTLCAWEKAFGQRGPSLGSLVDTAFKETRVDGLIDGGAPYDQLQQRVEGRVRNMRTLPAMPEIVLRIMKLVGDPNSSAQEMEDLLLSDAAIVEKLLQVINSPFFAGAGKQGDWTLKESIVRMGLQKVGAVAQQVKMMNSFAKPEDSEFDLRRFWEHSVGCSMLADKIMEGELVDFEGTIEFDDYWIGAILHDIGKLILGLFFWDFYEMILNNMASPGAAAAQQAVAQTQKEVSDGGAAAAKEGEAGAASAMISFREAEKKLADTPDHEQVGMLMLMKSNIKEELVHVVQAHHEMTASSSTLVCLVHLVDNICKDLGMGSIEGEPSHYDEHVLKTFNLDEASLTRLKETLSEFIVPEIKAMVGRCL